MLRKLHIRNFRCFSDHTIPFRQRTIIVGPNNAGKSTTVEALRLLTWVVERYQSANYTFLPPGLGKDGRIKGFKISQDLAEGLAEPRTFHHYEGPPARITGEFSKGVRVQVFIAEEGAVYGRVIGRDGKQIENKNQARRLEIPRIQALPQVAPLLDREERRKPEYVRRHMSSRLSHQHFRNQLALLREFRQRFVDLAEETWPGLRVDSLMEPSLADDPSAFHLMLRDHDFVGEAGAMGHGLQMWLQTIWFLARTPDEAPIVLDEPDVYLHADLQRKLIRLLQQRGTQVIVATHSLEILSEVVPGDVLIIDRRQPASHFSVDSPELQDVVERLGGVQNLQMARLWSTGRCLIVEGDDLKILRAFHTQTNPAAPIPIDTIPCLKLGGSTNWQQALGAARVLSTNDKSVPVGVYCLLDRDFRPSDDVEKLLQVAHTNGIRLHVWNRSEIENYVLVPSAIARLILREKRAGSPEVDESTIRGELHTITENLRDTLLDQISDFHHKNNRDKTIGFSNQFARDLISSHWGELESRLHFVPGKDILSALSTWSIENYGVSLSAVRIASAMRIEEVPQEVRHVLSCIDDRSPFQPLDIPGRPP